MLTYVLLTKFKYRVQGLLLPHLQLNIFIFITLVSFRFGFVYRILIQQHWYSSCTIRFSFQFEQVLLQHIKHLNSIVYFCHFVWMVILSKKNSKPKFKQLVKSLTMKILTHVLLTKLNIGLGFSLTHLQQNIFILLTLVSFSCWFFYCLILYP